MTRTTTRSRLRRSARTTPVYLPHSSWSSAGRQPAPDVAISPDDFWARLGL